MPTYGYRCAGCGPFDVVMSMAEVRAQQQCPRCGLASRRIFSAPAVRQVSPGLSRALNAQERSASEPQVVTAVPPTKQRVRQVAHPRQAALPRP